LLVPGNWLLVASRYLLKGVNRIVAIGIWVMSGW